MLLSDSEIQLRFMEIVSRRASAQYIDNPDISATPSVLAEAIAKETSIQRDSLERFFWGDLKALGFEEIRKLTVNLDLQGDMFDLIIESFYASISKEVIIHCLEKVAEDYMDPTECQVCAQLESIVLDSDLLSYREKDLQHLLLDVLEHVVDMGSPINKAHFQEDDFSQPKLAPDIPRPESTLTPAMVAAFENLPHSEQVEVLALLYKKVAQSKEDSQSLIEIETLASLRSRYLSPLARDVFDTLANGPAIGLSSADLIKRLDLSNRRSLGQLERSVNNAIERVNEDNIEANLKNPLKTVTRGREKHYILDADTLENWRVLLRAEQKSKTSI